MRLIIPNSQCGSHKTYFNYLIIVYLNLFQNKRDKFIVLKIFFFKSVIKNLFVNRNDNKLIDRRTVT